MHRLAERIGKIRKPGLATGFYDLDKLIGGLLPGQLVILAARPGMGKTAFAINIADNVADAGTGVMFVSLEQSRDELSERLLCSRSQVSTDALAPATIPEPTLDAVTRAMAEIAKLPLIIDDGAPRTVAQVAQHPVINHQEVPDRKVKNGTSVTIEWPLEASSMLDDEKARFLLLAQNFAWFNPHLALKTYWRGSPMIMKAADSDWEKWLSRNPTSAHWYGVEHLERLAAAYLSHPSYGPDMPLGEFLKLFDGFSGSTKRKLITDEAGLTRQTLGTLIAGQQAFDRPAVERLLQSMQRHSRPVNPKALGLIGKDHFHAKCARYGADMETFRYRAIAETGSDGLPWLAEAAFAALPDDCVRASVIAGINWSPALPDSDPFDGLGGDDNFKGLLANQWIRPSSAIVLVVHVVIPRVQFFDRGKSRCDLGQRGPKLADLIKRVTGEWAKQMRREDREADAWMRRRDALTKSRRVSLQEAAFEVMEAAYLKASTNGTLPAKPRQIYYAARERILELTGKSSIRGQYFSQKLLIEYMRRNPDTTADWDVIWDARGHFTEPHTGRTFPLGTLEAREYLAEVASHSVASNGLTSLSLEYPTCGPKNRYQAILFIEKEGFDQLFDRVKLADRYDLAVMSTKGMSVTASRMLIDRLCSAHDIPVLIMRDFDKSGFSIAKTLVTDGDRYTFENRPSAIDLGLRLEDVRAHNLPSERVSYGKKGKPPTKDPRENLRENGASEAEIEFLCHEPKDQWAPIFEGRRVELNAFASGELVAWIESKLEKHGIEKVVPDRETTEAAWRRMTERHLLNELLRELAHEVHNAVRAMKVPRSLRKEIVEALQSKPADTWDDVMAQIVRRQQG